MPQLRSRDLVREAMRITGVKKGVEITTLADIPSEGSGLGSSSSVTVALLHALYAHTNTLVTAGQLADHEVPEPPYGVPEVGVAVHLVEAGQVAFAEEYIYVHMPGATGDGVADQVLLEVGRPTHHAPEHVRMGQSDVMGRVPTPRPPGDHDGVGVDAVTAL